MRAIRDTGGNAGWVSGLDKTLEYARSLNELLTRSNVDFQSFIPCYSSSKMMKTSQNLVGKLGRGIFSNSNFQDAVKYFTPEGTTRLLKSLDQFTQTAQANQSIFAGLVFEDIGTNLLKPKLNEWANGQGSTIAKNHIGHTVAKVGHKIKSQAFKQDYACWWMLIRYSALHHE